MGSKSSETKAGTRSSSIKGTTSRYGIGETPRARAKPGAFGKEGLDRETGGKLKTPSEAGAKERRRPLSRRRAA